MDSFEIRNKLRDIPSRFCGEGKRTLILASIGTSSPDDSLELEFRKALVARELQADVVTDHSFFGDIISFHRQLVMELDIPVSVVGCYELAARYPRRSFGNVPPEEPIMILREQAQRGMDIITVHASLKKSHLNLLKESSRVIPSTSKGGGIISSYMRTTRSENPYFEFFDEILEIFAEYGVTLSLGTSFRTGTVCDKWDDLLDVEVETMAGLVQRAMDAGVNVMVEGLGHVPIDQIGFHVNKTKLICHGVPYRVLPMATDVALGYDHISGAIAGAIAVAAGADAITCMSRAEHIGLPSIEELEESIITARIAAHCGELVKLGDFSSDLQMSKTRWRKGCQGDWKKAVYPQGAKRALETKGRLGDQLIQCGMCGEECGIKSALASII